MAPVGDAGNGMHQDHLSPGRAAACSALEVDRGGHVYERQGHELGTDGDLFPRRAAPRTDRDPGILDGGATVGVLSVETANRLTAKGVLTSHAEFR
jgi:hypothetical protein